MAAAAVAVRRGVRRAEVRRHARRQRRLHQSRQVRGGADARRRRDRADGRALRVGRRDGAALRDRGRAQGAGARGPRQGRRRALVLVRGGEHLSGGGAPRHVRVRRGGEVPRGASAETDGGACAGGRAARSAFGVEEGGDEVSDAHAADAGRVAGRRGVHRGTRRPRARAAHHRRRPRADPRLRHARGPASVAVRSRDRGRAARRRAVPDDVRLQGAALKRVLLLLLFAATAYAADPLIDSLGPGDAESKWFTVAVAHKAMALAGLGRNDDAIWYWHVALNLYPAIGESDMSMFGAPAEFLKAHPLVMPKVPPFGGAIHAPVTLKRVEPRYPQGAMYFHVTGIAIFESVITSNGDVRDVQMLKGLPSASLSYCALEALRQWKFKPATRDGQPIDVLFNLPFNFKMRN